MKRKIEKHIQNQDFVKVFIVDQDDSEIRHFCGIIFEQNGKFLFMNDFSDFNYDGFVVLRKSNISEIKHTENEKFFKYLIDSENITNTVIERIKILNFSLGEFNEMFLQLRALKSTVIIESKYGKDDRFQIGQIELIDEKKVKLKYFNARGQIDFKPVTAKYKEITYIRIDSPYANIFNKYSKEVE